jgi:hypothetical protein
MLGTVSGLSRRALRCALLGPSCCCLLSTLGACTPPSEGAPVEVKVPMQTIQTVNSAGEMQTVANVGGGDTPVAPPIPTSNDGLIITNSDSDEATELPAGAVFDAGDEQVTLLVTQDCARTEVPSVDTTMVQPADIVIAIDSSRSMEAEIGFVQDNMNQFSQRIIDSGIDVHVILLGYPGEDADAGAPGQGGLGGGNFNAAFGICIDAPLGSGTCPADTNLPIYFHEPTVIGSNDGLNQIIDSYDNWSQQLRAEATKFLVIVTDDDATQAPNDSADSFITSLQALDPEMWTEWSFNGIFCGAACEEAAAIGTVYQTLVAQTNGVSGELCDQDFEPVFNRLAEQIILNAGVSIACEWDFPAPPEGQTFSVDLVEVSRTSTADGTVTLTRVDALEQCAPGSWYFDNLASPTKILACPETCEAMQDQEGGRIDVVFGCEETEGCAATDAADIGAADAGGSCELALPPPPKGGQLDFGTINVRYTNEVGIGIVLGVVPSPEECANFGGGWYYDDPADPMAIVLCPQTCEEYQAGGVNDIQALFGCDTIPAEPPPGVK